MSLYAIGDLHLSLGTKKPMDIFSGWENYTEKIRFNWNYIVKPSDTVVIVGDISWAMNLNESEKDFEFINSLNGKKIILKGNHDYWFTTKKKAEDFWKQKGFDTLNMLFNNAFEYENYCICGTRGWINEPDEDFDAKIMAREVGRLKASLNEGKKLGKEPIVFLHYPPIFANNYSYDILDVIESYNVSRVFYGHLHSKSCNIAYNGFYKNTKYQLVSCDYTQFNPFKVL